MTGTLALEPSCTPQGACEQEIESEEELSLEHRYRNVLNNNITAVPISAPKSGV